MIETLYKTQTPEKGKSECYVLVLATRAASGGKIYAFMEEHGQWNDEMQRFLYKVKSISTEDQLSYQHARGMYEQAKGNLVRMGFVHCFGADGVRKEPASDQVPQAESAAA